MRHRKQLICTRLFERWQNQSRNLITRFEVYLDAIITRMLSIKMSFRAYNMRNLKNTLLKKIYILYDRINFKIYIKSCS